MDKEEDVASWKDEHHNDVKIQDRPNSNDSELDRNQGEDDVVKPGFHKITTIAAIAVATIAAILEILGFHIIAAIAAIIAVATIAAIVAIIWKPGEPSMESSNAKTCTNNIEITNASNVAIGDHNTIIVRPLVRQSGEGMNTLRISEEGFQAIMERGDRESVDEETQISSRAAVTSNIIVRDSYGVAIGENNVIYNVIYVQNSDEMFNSDFQTVSLEGALNFDQHRRADQNNWRSVRELLFGPVFPPRSELSQLPSPGVDPRVQTVFNRMREIVDQLYPLRDCGKWLEFGDALNGLHQKYDSHPEIKCFLLLEESVKLTYQKCLKEARKKAEESLQIVDSEANKIDGAVQDVLRVLANIALASIYRRLPKKKLGKAFQCLRNATENGVRLTRIGNLTIPDFVLALLDYEQARFYMEFAAVKSDTKCCNREASKFLGRCIDRCRALNDNNQLYTAKNIFALINFARLSLPSATRQSQPGQCQMIKKQCARQAEKHLEEYERSHSRAEGSPVAARVKYLMTRSELCFLKTEYTRATDYACQALADAMKYGFELETVPAQNHLDHICRCCASITAQGKHQRVKDLSNNYNSSTTDSDKKYNIKSLQRAT